MLHLSIHVHVYEGVSVNLLVFVNLLIQSVCLLIHFRFKVSTVSQHLYFEFSEIVLAAYFQTKTLRPKALIIGL